MCWGIFEIVALFVNDYEVMDWGLGGSYQMNEQEGT